jgi:hypothetical protein
MRADLTSSGNEEVVTDGCLTGNPAPRWVRDDVSDPAAGTSANPCAGYANRPPTGISSVPPPGRRTILPVDIAVQTEHNATHGHRRPCTWSCANRLAPGSVAQ